LVCNSNLIECVNLGFINSVWHYKLILKEKLDGVIRGDNLTIGNKLHILSEFYDNKDYQSLEIIVQNCNTNINSQVKDKENDKQNYNDNDKNYYSVDSEGLISYKNPLEKYKETNNNKDNKDKENSEYDKDNNNINNINPISSRFNKNNKINSNKIIEEKNKKLNENKYSFNNNNFKDNNNDNNIEITSEREKSCECSNPNLGFVKCLIF
jgi:hypothetical protein